MGTGPPAFPGQRVRPPALRWSHRRGRRRVATEELAMVDSLVTEGLVHGG